MLFPAIQAGASLTTKQGIFYQRSESRDSGGQARIIRDHCVLTIDRNEFSSEEDKINEKLSDWLERPVTLSKPNAGETRNIEIEWDDGTAEILQDPDVFEFSTAPGWFFDSSSSLNLMGSATLDFLEKRVGPGSGDVRRFRPNLLG